MLFTFFLNIVFRDTDWKISGLIALKLPHAILDGLLYAW